MIPNYVAILRAIAYGAQTQHLISKRTGLSSGHISKYLSVLRDTGFVERRVPITEDPAASRRGHYDITDPSCVFTIASSRPIRRSWPWASTAGTGGHRGALAGLHRG